MFLTLYQINVRILALVKLKAFAEDKFYVAQAVMTSARTENFGGKGDNAGYHHGLLFPQGFQKPSVSGSLKLRRLW